MRGKKGLMMPSTMPRLQQASLRDASRTARRGSSAAHGRIVHLGIRTFHRAHQAVYTAEAIERDGGDWGILGVDQQRAAAVKALVPQDGLFRLVERGPEEDAARSSPRCATCSGDRRSQPGSPRRSPTRASTWSRSP